MHYSIIQKTNLQILIFKILIIVGICPQELTAKTLRYRCILREEPSTHITVGWDQVSGSNPVIYYGITDFGTDYQKYPESSTVQRTVIAKGMNNHFARLSKLKPNTVYYFVVVDSEGVGQRYSFCTLPDDHNTRLSIVCGGDSRNLKTARLNANRLAGKLRPHFIMFAGDMTGGDTDREWVEWMNDWQQSFGADGRITAIVPARGNHEFSNKTLYDVFDVKNPDNYYAISINRGLLRVYTLNSMMPSSGEQRDWLETDLMSNQSVAWRFAQYHHPMRPHTKRKAENEMIRKNWAPLFETFGVQLVLECDSHTAKYTWPIRSSNEKGNVEGFLRDDANGVVYIGEGGWGAPLRAADDAKTWTRATESINHINWVFIDTDKIEVRTLKTDNANGVSALSDLNRFQYPIGIDLWKPNGEELISIENRNKDRFRPLAKQVLTEIKTLKAMPLEDGSVELYWQGLYEEKGMSYKVQYSTNKLYWSTLGTVAGLGANTIKPNEYLFTDKTKGRGAKIYYRVVALAENGTERCKEEVELRNLSSDSNMETLQVSLATGILQVNLEIPMSNEDCLFEVFDINRKQVFIQRMPLSEGKHTIPLNIRHLKSGYYLLEISFGAQILRKSIQINK